MNTGGNLSFIRRGTILLGIAALVSLVYFFQKKAHGPEIVPVDESAVVAGPHPQSLIAEPTTLVALEARGFTLNRMLGAPGTRNSDLMESRAYADLVSTLKADLAELDARPGIGGEKAMNHPFKLSWLSDPDARFELVGVVPRLDRAFVTPHSCGEVRLVYRLALARKGRPGTRLPMTLSVLMIVPESARCQELARSFTELPERGPARVAALAAILTRRAAAPRRIEVNLQNLHGPSVRRDSDDHAEYLMRSFDVTPEGLTPHPLLDTPREDLTADERKALAREIVQRFAEIDQGTFVMPDAFAAKRAISVAPRGLARRRNRVYAQLFGDDAERLFVGLPYEKAKLVKSPRGLLRRLDQGTCQGCHESRSIAGFHLLGEERTADTFNTLAVGHGNHLEEELPWRERQLLAVASGAVYIEPRPLAEHAAPGPGGYGARCGMGDPGFRELTCAPGLTCKDFVIDELGACTHAAENREGDACERATVTFGAGPDGDTTSPEPKEPCTIGGAKIPSDACSPNAYGFPGGLCSDACERTGEVTGDAICAPLPAAGYESDCFATDVPIETCIATHLAKRRVRSCDRTHACRDDFACVRVPNAPDGTGACVPPYFVFQARVDGPRTDR